jgi:hypothetical protein
LKVKRSQVDGKFRQKAATAGVIRRQLPATFPKRMRPTAANSLPPLAAFCGFFRAVAFPNELVRRWCLTFSFTGDASPSRHFRRPGLCGIVLLLSDSCASFLDVGNHAHASFQIFAFG